MTVVFAHRTVEGVPLLLAEPEGRRGPLPTVLWFHGLAAGKDVHRPELERVARGGFLAVGVDAVGHGERRFPDLDARIAGPLEDARQTMLGLAEATAAELPAVVRALAHEGLADPERVAAVGISMGGYLVYRAVMVEPSIRTAVALLGSPEWPGTASPHRHPEAFHRSAILSITAERDENVPPAAARRFHQALAASHPAPEHTRYVELAGAVHLMSAEHWSAAMDHTLEWLTRHAARAGGVGAPPAPRAYPLAQVRHGGVVAAEPLPRCRGGGVSIPIDARPVGAADAARATDVPAPTPPPAPAALPAAPVIPPVPAESVELRTGAVIDTSMVRSATDAAVKHNTFPSRPGYPSGMTRLETHLHVEAWVKNTTFEKNVWVDVHVFEAGSTPVHRTTLPLAYSRPAADGGDVFVLDATVYDGLIATPGSVTLRPDVRVVQYRLYVDLAGTVFTDGILHRCELLPDYASG